VSKSPLLCSRGGFYFRLKFIEESYLYIKMKWLFIAVVLLTLLFVACQRQPAPGNVIDDLGRSVRLDKVPQRIVSLSPSNTEIVFALGLDDKVVGVTTFCDYPEAAKAKPKVADFSKVDMERVVSVQPDLILATNIHKETVIPALERLGIAVLAVFPETLDKLIADIRLIGEATGKEREAGQLVASMEGQIRTVTGKTGALSSADRPMVLHLTWYDPLWTTGSGTMVDNLITKAGGRNIASDLTGHKNIDLETVIQRNPQVIIVMGGHGEAGDKLYNYVLNEPRLKVTQAVANQRVYKIDADLYARTTPRTVEALEQLARLIHPELFSK